MRKPLKKKSYTIRVDVFLDYLILINIRNRLFVNALRERLVVMSHTLWFPAPIRRVTLRFVSFILFDRYSSKSRRMPCACSFCLRHLNNVFFLKISPLALPATLPFFYYRVLLIIYRIVILFCSCFLNVQHKTRTETVFAVVDSRGLSRSVRLVVENVLFRRRQNCKGFSSVLSKNNKSNGKRIKIVLSVRYASLFPQWSGTTV